ncbi:MAG: putative membrane-anchored protein, partial [Bacteroidia bacterium]
APVSLFFLLVGSDYQTYKLINVLIMSIAGASGTYLFYKYITIGSGDELTTTAKKRTNIFLNLWLLMFGLIGTNLGFAISPFFRNPEETFMLFTPKNENFFTHLLNIFF